jgi:hypothetical protein
MLAIAMTCVHHHDWSMFIILAGSRGDEQRSNKGEQESRRQGQRSKKVEEKQRGSRGGAEEEQKRSRGAE